MAETNVVATGSDDTERSNNENQRSRGPNKAKASLVAGREGFVPKFIILPQLLNAAAFLASMYSTTSCEFITAHYNYSMEQAYLKPHVGYGMLSRESASIDSSQCHWYSINDIETFFDTPFRVAAAASALGTVIGGLNFIYSLFLWCRVVTGSSMRFLCYVTIICVICGVITQIVFVSQVCMTEKCSKLPDGSDGSCVESYCSLGVGSYFSFVALFCWLLCLYFTIRLLQNALRQYEEQKRRIHAINDQAFEDVEDGYNGGRKSSSSDTDDNKVKKTNDRRNHQKIIGGSKSSSSDTGDNKGKKANDGSNHKKIVQVHSKDSHKKRMLAGFLGGNSDDEPRPPTRTEI